MRVVPTSDPRRGAANRPGQLLRLLATCQDAGMTEQRFDLVVRNGTIVTPGHREQADVGISGGRIAQLGGTMTGAGGSDAGGLLGIPGGRAAHLPPTSPHLAPEPA